MDFKSTLRKVEVSFMKVVAFLGRKIVLAYGKTAQMCKKSGKKYFKTAAFAIVILYVIGAVVFGIRLYRQNRVEKIDRMASYIYPFPVANTGRSLIFDKEMQQKTNWSKTFAGKMQMAVPEDISKRIVDDMVYDAVIMQEASSMNIKVTKDDIEKTFSIAASGIGGEDQATTFVKDNYGMSIAKFKQLLVPKIALEKIRDGNFVKVKARHIVIKDEGRAKDILKKAKEGAKFEDLAKDNSEDQSSKEEGGLLAGGEFLFRETSGLPQEFEDALFKMKKGDISELVKTDLGYHIIKVEEREGSIEETMTAWLDSLKKKYPTRVWFR